LTALGLGILSQTTNYVYTITADAANNASNIANPNNSNNLRGYVGGVDLIGSAGAATTTAILCQKDNAGPAVAASVTLYDDLTTNPACASGFKTIE
jgi:hypothetical protein